MGSDVLGVWLEYPGRSRCLCNGVVAGVVLVCLA